MSLTPLRLAENPMLTACLQRYTQYVRESSVLLTKPKTFFGLTLLTPNLLRLAAGLAPESPRELSHTLFTAYLVGRRAVGLPGCSEKLEGGKRKAAACGRGSSFNVLGRSGLPRISPPNFYTVLYFSTRFFRLIGVIFSSPK